MAASWTRSEIVSDQRAAADDEKHEELRDGDRACNVRGEPPGADESIGSGERVVHERFDSRAAV